VFGTADKLVDLIRELISLGLATALEVDEVGYLFSVGLEGGSELTSESLSRLLVLFNIG
jgi:hypothetical protein